MFAPEYKLNHKLPDAWEPVIYSKKIDDKVHDNVIFNSVFNRDYEGELKGIGSKLVIRSWPDDLKPRDYILGTPITPQRHDASAKEVTVGRAWELSLVMDQWDLMNSDMKQWESVRSKKIAVACAEFLEGKWFAEAQGAAVGNPYANWNFGNAAGINGDIQLGTEQAAVELVADKSPTSPGAGRIAKNVLQHFYDIDMVHTRHQGASSATGKFIITVPEVLKVLREFDAFERTSCNDSVQDLLRRDVMSYGRLGATGFDIYVTNRLRGRKNETTGKTVYPLFFGDTRAWTYADLFSETGVKPDPKIPGIDYEYHIGGYDWFLAQPEYFGVSYVAV